MGNKFKVLCLLLKVGKGVRVNDIDISCNTIGSGFGIYFISWIYIPESHHEEKDAIYIDQGQLSGICLLSKIADQYFRIVKKL